MSAAYAALAGGHAFVSFLRPDQLALVVAICQTFAVDNGAFSAWMDGRPILDWSAFYTWAEACRRVPSCDFAVIPDVIDGSEADNDALLAEWPLGKHFGAPVWHMHESLDRLLRLAADYPSRICLGSSGEFAKVGTPAWWARMGEAMSVLCDREGRPLVRMHGLRMLNPKVFTKLPLASADSTNIGRNIGIDLKWKGTYQPVSKDSRARVLRDRIETPLAPAVWSPQTEGATL